MVSVTGLIVAFVAGVIIISIYIVIRPSKKSSTGWQPFPDRIRPGHGDIPDANVKIEGDCTSGLVPCFQDGDCQSCGGSDMQCTVVTNDMDVWYPEGSKVPPGSWCLPKDLHKQGCSTSTGQIVWSQINGVQKWSCLCRYPELYDGASCTKREACRVDSDPDNPHNVLVSKGGSEWDPSNATNSPYESTCRCGGIDSQNRNYISMPGDEFRCQSDQCFVSQANAAPGWDPEKNDCDCGKFEDSRLIKSNVDHKCRPSDGTCQNWNSDTMTCACPTESQQPGTSQKFIMCNSKYLYRGKEYPTCPDEHIESPNGGYCYDPCSDLSCGSGGVCKYTDGGESAQCLCKSGYTVSDDGKTCNKCTANDGKCEKSSECCEDRSCKKPCSCVISTCHDECQGGCSCFIAGTPITLSDGTVKPIEDIVDGDRVLSYGGVTAVRTREDVNQPLGNQPIYGFNDFDPFFTSGHPFMTTDGWKSIDPEMSKKENVYLKVGKLQVGDIVMKATVTDGDTTYTPITIKRFSKKEFTPDTVTYGLHLVGGKSYHAHGFAVAMSYPEITSQYIATGISRLSDEERVDLMSALKRAEGPLNKAVSDGFLRRLQQSVSSKTETFFTPI